MFYAQDKVLTLNEAISGELAADGEDDYALEVEANELVGRRGELEQHDRRREIAHPPAAQIETAAMSARPTIPIRMRLS